MTARSFLRCETCGRGFNNFYTQMQPHCPNCHSRKLTLEQRETCVITTSPDGIVHRFSTVEEEQAKDLADKVLEKKAAVTESDLDKVFLEMVSKDEQ